MRKVYTSALAIALVAGAATAQTPSAPAAMMKKTLPFAEGHATPHDPYAGGQRGATIWSDDFSTPSNWTIEHAGPINLDWEIGIGLEGSGSFPIPPIESTTAPNGYAMLDSDGANNTSSNYEDSRLTTANSISTVGYPNVVLEFQTQYRKWTDEECYVVISTDGFTWPTLDPGTDISGMPNVYRVFPGMQTQDPVDNPTTIRINISNSAGDQPQIWVRFNWTGIYGYLWFVDDVSIQEQPAYELVMLDGFLSNTGNGEEHCRIPQNELPTDMRDGGNAINQGVNALTNVKLAMLVRDESNAVVFGDSVTVATLDPNDTLTMDVMTAVPALPEGDYFATFTASCDEGSSEAFPANNTWLRNFTVTNDEYSLDGMFNHPAGYEQYASIGTDMFTDGADDLIAMTYYPISNSHLVYGIELILTSSTTTTAGGTVIVSIHDTTNILADDPTQPLIESQDYVIDPWNVDNGRAVVFFDAPFTLDPGGYYAAARMFSNGNTNDWRILDDKAVPQPDLASTIFIPGDQTYTNGNALGIRLVLDAIIGVQENTELKGVELYPNPSNGLITVNTREAGNYTVEVMDATGRVVRTERMITTATFDLSELNKGAYSVRVSNEKASAVYSVVLQ